MNSPPLADAKPAADWDALPALDVAELPSIFPEALAGRDARIGLDAERKHVRTAAGRRHLNMLRVANAAKALDTLPLDGQSYHIIMAGNFAGWDFVSAVLRLAAPAAIRELNVSTLGFNSRNAAELFDLLDRGDVQRCSFIFSCYYRSNEPQVADALIDGLRSRGHRVLAARCHAKVLLMELTDGRHIVIESSANLRSCHNVEQCCITHDRDLLYFHRAWMLHLLNRSGQ